jgi:hypothetical protein
VPNPAEATRDSANVFLPAVGVSQSQINQYSTLVAVEVGEYAIFDLSEGRHASSRRQGPGRAPALPCQQC